MRGIDSGHYNSPVNQEKILAEKIKALRAQRGWTQKDLAEKTGLSMGAISEIERGLYQFHRRSTIEKIARAFGLAPEELLDAGLLAPISGVAKFPLYGGGVEATLTYYEKGAIKSYGGRVPFKPAPGVPAPLWSKETLISLLDNPDKEEEPIGAVPVSLYLTERCFGLPDPKGLFVLEMTDDSMYPTIQTGDFLLFQEEHRHRFGPVVLVRAGSGEPMIRRLKPSEGRIAVVSDNPAIKPQEFEPDELKVYGLALGIIMRKLI